MSTTTEKQDAWAEYFWQHPVDASLEEKLNRIAQIEEDWLRVDNNCSDYSSHGSTPVKCDGLQSAGKLEEDKVEDAITNTDGSDEDQSQGKGFMLESHTPINEVCDEKPVTLNKRKLDTNGNLIPLPPATPPRKASNCQALPSVIEKNVTVFAGPAGASSSDTTPSAVTHQSTLISTEDHLHSTNESPRRPYRISKAWKAAEAANRSIVVESSPLDAPIIEGTVNSSGRYKTQDVSGEGRQSEEDLENVEHTDLGLKNTGNGSIGVESRPQDAPITEGKSRQSEEDLDCVEHADLGLKNTAEPANGPIGVESSPRDALITEGEVNSSDNYQAQDTSGEDRQSKEDLECVEHADLGIKNGSEKPIGGAENETGEIVQGDIVNGDGGIEGPDADEGNMEARDSSEDIIDKKEEPGDKVGKDAETQCLGEDPMAKEPYDISANDVPGNESAESSVVGNENIDARQPSDDSTNEEEEPADGVESDLPVSDGIAEELDETIGTGVLDVEDDDLDVEDEETEPQHPVKVDIADEVSPMRSFFSRGLALYMEARGFVEPGVEAMGGEGPEVDHGQNTVESLMRKDESFIEWGHALLLEAMDGSIGI